MVKGRMQPRPPIDLTPFRHLFPFTSRYAEVNGLRMHYVDEGRGEPIVMVHGNPTWSFYFRKLISGFSGNHRAIAPDHIGCGLSARPGPSEYGFRLQNRIDDLEALLDHLGVDRNITLVLHDWGGMIGMALAVRHPERIARLVLLNTAAFRKPAGKPLPLALKLIRSYPFLATPAVLGLNFFACGAAWTASAKGLRSDVRQGLLAPYNSWRNRLAILRFVQDIPLLPGDPSYAILEQVDRRLDSFSAKPVLVCWGERDFVFDRDYLAEWCRRFPQAEVHRFKKAGHYVLEDVPDRILDLMTSFLKRHPLAH
jgi:pimeloyl-ACP methyl ester carboxylesterase